MRKLIPLLGPVMIMTNGNAHGQQVEQEAVLEPIVISAPLRREADIATATSSVTVIDEAEIRASAASDLASLLRLYPGVSIATFGGFGSNAEVTLRGVSPTQTLVLINGVRASSATSGTTSIFNVPLESISRIEIAKGAHSAQYGSDAIGGVINIITKDGSGCPDGKDRCSTVTVGVEHPWGASGRVETRGKTEGGLNYGFGITGRGTRGYDFTGPTSWGHEPDDDGFRQGSFDLRLSQDFDWGRLYADGFYARGMSEFDAFPDSNEARTVTFAGKVGAQINHSDDWFSRIEVSNAIDDARNHRDGVPGHEDYRTVRSGVLLTTQKTLKTDLAEHVFSGGVEAYREQIDTNVVSYAVEDRTLAGIFGQYALSMGSFNVDAGLRHDYNEQFGEATTYNLGARYELMEGLSARASFGTGFRAPTFNDLYYPGWSNPNLLPERSKSVEAGLAWQIDPDTSLDVAIYRTWISEAIALDASYLPYNIGSARISGIEATMSHRINDSWTVNGSLDLRQPRDEDTGNDIPNRERFKGSIGAVYTPTESLTLSANLLYVASRYIDASNTRKLPDFVTMDFAATYDVDEQSQWKLAVLNAFDEDYSTREGFRAPGRTISLSVSRHF